MKEMREESAVFNNWLPELPPPFTHAPIFFLPQDKSQRNNTQSLLFIGKSPDCYQQLASITIPPSQETGRSSAGQQADKWDLLSTPALQANLTTSLPRLIGGSNATLI